MKILKVNRSTYPMTFKKCKNLGELIAVIEKEGENEKQFITQLTLNNRPMDQEEEALLESLSINEVDNLVVKLSSLNEIIKETLTDTLYAIQSAQAKSIEFAKVFRKNYEVDDEKVKYVLIQCRQVIKSLEEIFAAHNKQNFYLKHHSLWLEAEKELTNILQCIFQARKMPGYEVLSDLMEFELVQALDQWEEVIENELLDNSALNGIFNLNNGAAKSDNEADV